MTLTHLINIQKRQLAHTAQIFQNLKEFYKEVYPTILSNIYIYVSYLHINSFMKRRVTDDTNDVLHTLRSTDFSLHQPLHLPAIC